MIGGTGSALVRTTSRSTLARSDASSVRPRRPAAEARARELMTMAAHDLRSPLAAIRFRAEAIVHRWRAGNAPPCDEWASVVVGMSAAAEDAFHIIDDLLGIERLEHAGPAAPRPPVVDVRTVIDKAIDREKLGLERAGCHVTVLCDEGFVSVRGRWDRAYLLRVFGNLLRNAATHAPGAPILITLARRGDRLGIVFADRGPGLAEHRRSARVLRPLVAAAGSEIHGVGLWIVRRAVERLHGRLRIHSRAREGVTFDIELPGLERLRDVDSSGAAAGSSGPQRNRRRARDPG